MDFIKHFRKMTAAEIVADIQQSMDDLEDLNPKGSSFGAKMVRWSSERIAANSERLQANGRKGGRPRKNPEALVSQKSLPGTSSGNAAAVINKAVTAPAGQNFEARQGLPGAQPLSASGEHFERTDAHAREDWDASATVRAQSLGGDAATREGAVDNSTPQGDVRDLAPSPSKIQNRPGKSATPSVERSIHQGGSERGDGGLPIPAGQKGEGGLLTAPSPTPPLGIMKNVRISPEQLGRYRAEYGDPTRLIDALSTYIAKSGKRYKSHFAALVSWARRDIERGIDPETGSKADQLSRIRFAARAAGIDAFSGKRIDFATGEVIEPASGNFPEIPYNPPELGEAE